MRIFNNKRKIKLKQLINLKINVLYNFKVLKFKKTKWKTFLYHFKNQFKPSKYKKYKIVDQAKFLINKKNLFELFYKNQHFKKLFFFSKIFNFFYGNFSKNYYNFLKNKICKSFKIMKTFVFEHLENRLDSVLVKSKFFFNLKSAKQFINNGSVIVNKKQIKISSLILKSGDKIKLNFLNLKDYKFNLVSSISWPITSNSLVINYKIMKIIFLGNFAKENRFIFYSFFYLRLHKLLIS